MKKHELFCTLVNHIMTDEGDFIPAGTPVDVLGISGKERPGYYESDGRPAIEPVIECRVRAYVFCDTFDPDKPCVGSGLLVGVSPDNLLYRQST
jgi:hypothetical protein